MLYANMSPDDVNTFSKELKQTKEVKWYQRIKIILLSAKQKSVPELAELFDRCEATIRSYINRYNAEGRQGLLPQPRKGAPAKVPLSKAEWEELLHQSPSQFEQLQTAARNWSQELVCDYLRLYHGILLTQPALSKLLKRQGIRWNRGKLKVTSPDPLYTVKRERIDTLKKKAVQGTLTSHDLPETDVSQPVKLAKLVFFGATDLHWCPDVGKSDVARGSQLSVDSPGVDNPWYALFGSLEYPTGEGLYTIHNRKRHQEVRAHFERLLARDPDAFWIVILDNASAHTTPKLDAFFQQHQDRLGLVFQPTYSPHLNLIERLWRLMRGQMTRNQFYQSLKELAEAIVEWFETLPFAKFCSLIPSLPVA